MIADPELEAWLRGLPNGDRSTPSISALRQPRARPAGPAVAVVTDNVTSPGGVRFRAYRHGASWERTTCVYVHGGGFVFGDLESHDRACRRLATIGEVDVVAADYRRAPEWPAPAAIEDVVDVLRHARERVGDTVALGLAGDSAGSLIAYLAAELAQVRLQGLLLVNPNVDLTLAMPSVAEKGEGWGLSAGDLRWFVDQWAPTETQLCGPTLNPLQRPVSELPMTTVVTSEHDPLKDEGIALADHLRRAGRLHHHEHLDGMVHGVINLDTVSPSARRMGDTVLRDFAAMLHGLRHHPIKVPSAPVQARGLPPVL